MHRNRHRIVVVTAGLAILGIATPATAATAATAARPDTSEMMVVDASPTAVVRSYVNAINAGDYRTAWDLGGKHLSRSYETFVRGFDTTAYDSLTILGTHGDVVTVGLDAQRTDGSNTYYEGTYTVHNGVITAAHLVAR